MEQLNKSVQSVIETDRIGSPVFLRCVLNLERNGASLLQPIADIVSLANVWMPSQPESVYAQGEADSTQVSVMVHYVDGQIALLSVNRVESETSIDIMLVGSKGVIYHETPIGRHYLSGTPPVLDNSGNLSDVINESLSSGQPILLEE